MTGRTTFFPKVGDKCHWRIYTDVCPVTVIGTTVMTVTVRVDRAEIEEPPEMAPGGFAAVVTKPAKWKILDDPNGRIIKFGLRNDGRWVLVGHRGMGNTLGEGWRYYHDYGF
jgi:hypothetical protein